MPSIVHFEIPADNVARATAFYETTFGWTITAYPMPAGEEYYSVVTRKKGEPGIDGGLMKRKDPGQPFTNYINVPSIDEMLQRVQANGGTVMMPKQEIGPNMGWIALFIDTEHNMIGLHQAPPSMPSRARGSRRRVAAKKTRGAAKKTRGAARKTKGAAKSARARKTSRRG